jgi:hypothetical protein
VLIRVASGSHKVKIRLRLREHGRRITVTVTIRTNRVVKVAVPRSVSRILGVSIL